ncbi:MAG: hypothetical protein AAF705_12900, partial [Bacteroidota bacterium]
QFLGASGAFTVNGNTTASINDGDAAIIDNYATGDSPFKNVPLSGPAGSGTAATVTVGGGENSWSIFVFTTNGYCNVFSSSNADYVDLS